MKKVTRQVRSARRQTKARVRPTKQAATNAAASAATTSAAVLTLPVMLDIQHVGELTLRLREHLDASGSLRLDASSVASADTAGLQLLVVARRAAGQSNRAFEWCGVSDALRATSRTLGLCDHLGLASSLGLT